MFYLGLISLYHLSSLSLQGHKSGHAQCIGNDDMQIHSYTCINNLRTTWYDKPRLCFYAFCIAWSAQNGICLACLLGSQAKSRIKIKTPFCCPVHWLQGRWNIQDHEGYCPHQVLTVFLLHKLIWIRYKMFPNRYPNFKSIVPPSFLVFRRPWVLMLQCCWSELKLIWKCLTRDPGE